MVKNYEKLAATVREKVSMEYGQGIHVKLWDTADVLVPISEMQGCEQCLLARLELDFAQESALSLIRIQPHARCTQPPVHRHPAPADRCLSLDILAIMKDECLACGLATKPQTRCQGCA